MIFAMWKFSKSYMPNSGEVHDSALILFEWESQNFNSKMNVYAVFYPANFVYFLFAYTEASMPQHVELGFDKIMGNF